MEGVVDFTEPEPLQLVEGVENPYESPWLWRVELYLMSKYYPEFVESSIFKVREAALKRSAITKEHHTVHRSLQSLENAIISDLNQHVRWTPQSPHRGNKGPVKPGIGSRYKEQREIEGL